MSIQSISTSRSIAPALPKASIWLAAVLAVLVMLAAEWVQGFPGLDNARGDNDSLMRLVEVRDLLAGQGWFDLTQYRLGLDGGTLMHWSRLVDVPIAAIVLLFSRLTGSATSGEAAALILWPALVFIIALYFLMSAARRIGGDNAILPAAVIGAICLYSIGLFAPGNIDHHNVQFALTAATLSFLLGARERRFGAYVAGATAGLSIAVGMETAPYVIGTGSAIAILYLIRGADTAHIAARFGLGFALTGLAVLVTTIAPSRWFTPACDAFSVVQFTVALVGGLGLALATSLAWFQPTPGRRALGLVVVGIVLTAVAAYFFPECLSAPYADVDARQKIYWLDAVREAQPAWSALRNNTVVAAGFFGTPLLALVVVAFALIRKGLRFDLIAIGVFLLAATFTAVWQLRGAVFAVGFAIVPLAAWIAAWRDSAAGGSISANLKMIGAWLLSINLTWSAAAMGVEAITGAGAAKPAANGTAASACESARDFAALASLPPATILSGINVGAPIIAYTHHRAVAAPYHRNTGNILAYEVFAGDLDAARSLLAGNHVSYVVICKPGDESPELTRDVPAGLHARLMRDDAPDWLRLLPESKGRPVEIYRFNGS